MWFGFPVVLPSLSVAGNYIFFGKDTGGLENLGTKFHSSPLPRVDMNAIPPAEGQPPEADLPAWDLSGIRESNGPHPQGSAVFLCLDHQLGHDVVNGIGFFLLCWCDGVPHNGGLQSKLAFLNPV